jgi:hypothetical protein
MAKHGAMPKYNFLLCNKRGRIRYPKTFYLTDIEAARQVAFGIARVSGGVVSQWNGRTCDQQKNLSVEVADETRQTVLTISFQDAEEAKS